VTSCSFYYQYPEELNGFVRENGIEDDPRLLIQVYFGWCELLHIQSVLENLKALFPRATILGMSTDGEICCGEVSCAHTVVVFSRFEEVTLRSLLIAHEDRGYRTGRRIADELAGPETRIILLFADGMHTDGDALVKGYASAGSGVPIAGGMAGDNARFRETYVCTREGVLSSGVAAVALEGKSLEVFRDYSFDWIPIGREFTVTRAEGNRVYTLDGRTAVETYAYYLGEETAKRLPAIGIEFPLMLERGGRQIARAVIGRHPDGSLSFAGSIEIGEKVRFGHGDPEHLLRAGERLSRTIRDWQPESIFVYSCMARRRFLPDVIKQEVSALQQIAPTDGLFTYGEFFSDEGVPWLFNETMTVVALRERGKTPCHHGKANPYPKSGCAFQNSIQALIHLANVAAREMLREENLRKEQMTFERLVESSPNGILLIRNGQLTFCNDKMRTMFGVREEKETFLRKVLPARFAERTLRGRSFYEYFFEKWREKKEGEALRLEWKFSREFGEYLWIEIYAKELILEEVPTIYLIFQDITDRKEMELELIHQRSRLYHQATHDVLTGLSNRTLFVQEMTTLLQSPPSEKHRCALLYLDLDRFKQINDSLGHDIGDRLLQSIARRLQTTVGTRHLLARVGGDEFVICLDDIVSREEIVLFARQVLEILRKPVRIDHYTLYTSASIGIALHPEDGDEVSVLFKYADTAMYRAKEEGGDRYSFYRSEMTEKAYREVMLERELHHAIEREEIEVYYQPQYDAASGAVVGVEALMRWNHPQHGLMVPSSFLELAQKTGQFLDLDLWMMRRAVAEISRLRERGLSPGILAMNITIGDLEESRLHQEITALIQRHRFDPEMLELEVTEGEMMTRPEQVIPLLRELSLLGLSIAIDDFGTGYSSLSKLRRLPLNRLKIDQSFIREIPQKRESESIIRAIINLAESLGLDVVAEGVETEEQRIFLLEEGCRIHQGFLYSRPVPYADLERLLRSL